MKTHCYSYYININDKELNDLSSNYLKELDKIIANQLITSVFQPIVSLRDGTILGYEALSRGPADSILANPENLFKIAAENNKSWKLDYLCRKTAITTAKKILKNQLLFLNVDPKILYDKHFHQGTTKRLLEKHQLNSDNIIFEITEKTAIDDYTNFCAILDHYRKQGYRIALDDVGSGYSGLTLLAKTSPHFIKIDIELIQSIHLDKIKQAIVKALVDLSHATNMTIIAEGIETEDELLTLIQLGVQYGQGFYLSRPKTKFIKLEDSLKDFIKKAYLKKEEYAINTRLSTPISEIATRQVYFSSSTLGKEILAYLHSNHDHMDIIIVDDNRPIGIISREFFLSNLATKYGISIYSNRPVKLLINTNPLILDYTTPVEQATKAAMARNSDHIYDSIIITKNNEYFGITTIKALLELTTKIELNRAKHANPLTGLPGNQIIDWESNRYINSLIPFSAIYIDLDNFKIYNDVYGFDAGDTVLASTANLLSQCLKGCSYEYFLGHIGGDDFIIFLPTVSTESLCQNIIDEFAKESKTFYSEEHQHQGYVTAKNRSDKIENFPLMTISLAVVVVNEKNITSKKLAAKAAEIKKICKKTWQNNFVIKNYN